MAKIAVPIVVHVDGIKNTITAIQELMDTYEFDGSYSDDFISGFHYCGEHIIEALKRIQADQKEGAKDGKQANVYNENR